jgi:hypothetical protein
MSSIAGPIPTGVQVSLNYNPSTGTGTWYRLSDHNRNPISISYDLIQQQQRMADGTLRQYVIARKFKITTDWHDFPTIDSNLVDYNPNQKEQSMSLGDSGNAHGGAWIKAFYEINAFSPVWVKLIFAQENIYKNSTGTDLISTGTVPTNAISPYTDSIHSQTNANNGVYNAFMTNFTYDIVKRRVSKANTGYDLVNLKIEFTEI